MTWSRLLGAAPVFVYFMVVAFAVVLGLKYLKGGWRLFLFAVGLGAAAHHWWQNLSL